MLDKQLLERLITERAVLQFAKETGIRVDDTQVERAIQRIAQDNKLSSDEFRKVLRRRASPTRKYRDDIRNEIIIQRLREREVDARLTVSDAEVDAFLASQSAQGGGDDRVSSCAHPGHRAGAGVARADRGEAPARRGSAEADQGRR